MTLRQVIKVEPLEEYWLRVTFDDGVVGDVNIVTLIRFTGVFAPMRDHTYFRLAAVHPEAGVVCWPNHADLDSCTLYGIVTGAPIHEPLTP